MMLPMRLSVVIPVRDERGNIPPLVAELVRALDPVVDYEVIIVDDGSTDGTADEAAGLKGVFGDVVTLIRHPVPLGQSTALLSGVRAARGEWIATLDGDGQNDPVDLPAALAVAARLDADHENWLVIGHRRLRRDRWTRRVSSRIANRVRDWVLHDATPDTGCGLKLLPRRLYLSLPYFDHMHRFIPALVRRERGVVRSVEVRHRERRSGRSKYGINDRLWVGLVDLVGVAWLARRSRLADLPEHDRLGD